MQSNIFVESKEIKTIVTCVKLFKNYIFAGVGGCLLTYQNNNNGWNLFSKYNVLNSQNIYRIVSNSLNLFLVCGGKHFCVIEYDFEKYTLRKTLNETVEDWIMDGQWVKLNESNGNTVICLLTAHSKLIHINSIDGSIIYSVTCWDRCILYSARIIYDTCNGLILFGGTVYNQIIVWSSERDAKGAILHKLNAHKGVIFSISYDEETERISSTSDDRTVCIWQVNFPQDLKNSSMLLKWKGANIILCKTIFAHTARVWDCCFLLSGKFASIGEDSQICIWSEDGKPESQASGHGGGGIRCLDCNLDFIVTGGVDGGISVWPLSSVQQPRSLPSLPSQLHNEIGLIPKHLCLTYDGSVIVFSEGGNIYMKLSDNEGWLLCFSDQSLKSYCILNICQKRKLLSLANIEGKVFILKVHNGELEVLITEKLIDGKIFSLHWLNDQFITCGPSGVLDLWDIHCLQGAETRIDKAKSFILPLSKERWSTCAIVTSGFLLVGDRNGSIHVYDINNSQVPLQTVHKAHKYRGVSCFYHDNDFIMSCGRDGTVKQFQVVHNKLDLVSTEKLKIDWAAKLININKYGTVVVGFHNVHFVLWNLRESSFILKLRCGGGHRSWDYFIDETSNRLIICYIKNKTVHYFETSFAAALYSTPLLGSHIKTINGGCLAKLGKETLFVTGGEDNSVRVCTTRLTQRAAIHSHLSSIRALCAVPLRDSLDALIFSVGGRAQIKAWKLSKQNSGNIVLAELTSHMLRPEDSFRQHWQTASPLIDAETRYMDVTALYDKSQDFVKIFVASSDGYLRSFDFSTHNNEMCLIGNYKINNLCLLKIFSYQYGNSKFCCIMSTAGKCSFWRITDIEMSEDVEHPEYQLHQSGINSCDHQVVGDHLLVVTGGDDSTVVMSLFKFMDKGDINLVQTVKQEHHVCQVTGIQILNDIIMSIGLDRKLIVYKWNLLENFLKIDKVVEWFSTIPDVHGLCTCTLNPQCIHILLFGFGMEVIELSCS